MRVTVLGLGEAGSLYARGLLEAKCEVTAFDPVAAGTPDGVIRPTSIANAVGAAEMVLSLVGGGAAEGAARESLQFMKRGMIFADMNSMSPDTKRRLAASAESAGILFVDVAIMAPVTRAGARTPLLVSGSGARVFVDTFPIQSLSLESVGDVAGAAAELKLLRSVFMKGLAALVFEAVRAADKSGAGEWVKSQIADEFGQGGRGLVDRLIEGTTLHATRREHEMVDAQQYLESIQTPTWMTQSTILWLRTIARTDSEL